MTSRNRSESSKGRNPSPEPSPESPSSPRPEPSPSTESPSRPPGMPRLVMDHPGQAHPSLSESPSPALGSLGPDGGAQSVGGYGTGSPSTDSKVRSTAKRRGLKKRELKQLAGHAVMTISGMLNAFLTAAESAERDGGLWLADKADVDGISDPLAGLASRRAPEGVDNPDVTDLARLVMAVAGYVGKQLRRKAELRGLPGPPGQFMDPGAFDPGDPDRWAPTAPGDDDQGDDDAPTDRESRGFLGRRFGGQTPTAPTTDSAGYSGGKVDSERQETPA